MLAVIGSPPASAAQDSKLVLVLDSSGSMKEKVGGDTKISVAKSALNVVVRKLPATAQVGLRVYGATVFDRRDKGACTDSQLVVPIGTGNRAELTAEIAKYKPYGETPISYSLRQAAKDLGGSGQRTIVLVSDGQETCKADPCATAAAISKQGIDLKIDVIGLRVNAKARSQLKCVAAKGNGTYYDADNKQQIEDSLDKLATRALRPFRLTGTPIRGTTDKAKAPTAPPGQYVDTFAEDDDKLYYRIPRTAPGSTLHVGLTARPKGFVPTVSMRIREADGAECDWGIAQVVSAGSGDPLLAGEVQSWKSKDTSGCNLDETLMVELSGSNDIIGQKFELVVREEAPVVSTRDLPGADADLDWQQMSPAKRAVKPPVPGSSLSDAPELPPGTYRTTILTGETQVFAVNTDWGQRLQAEIRVARPTGALGRALISDALDLQLLGPMRGRYANLAVHGLPRRDYQLTSDKAYRVADATPTVRYLNRSGTGAVTYASVPGPQFIAINMTQNPRSNFLVPYTLVVKVIGTAGEGAPDYVGEPSPTLTPSPTADPSTSPSSVPDVSPPAQGVPLPAVIAIAGGAVVVGVGGAVAVAMIRRRRRPTP